MRRIASVIGLPVENTAAYERLHADVWPAVLVRLSDSNVTNYSIFRHGELLFSYFEYIGDDYDADMAALSADPATREWLAECSPLQRPVEHCIEGEWWKTLPELFHLE